MRLLAAAGLTLMLAACSSAPSEAPEPSGPAPVAAGPSEPAPGTTDGDRCGAAQAQAFVGKPRSEVPIPIDPAKQRVACTTCPVTMDFSPERLNFFFDAATGVIKEVRCG
jgi:hypothetical protein